MEGEMHCALSDLVVSNSYALGTQNAESRRTLLDHKTSVRMKLEGINKFFDS